MKVVTEAQEILIGLQGFPESYIPVFRSMLAVSKKWSSRQWAIGSEHNSDIVFSLVTPEDNGEKSIVIRLQRRLSALRITDTLEFPLRVSGLLDILAQVEEFLAIDAKGEDKGTLPFMRSRQPRGPNGAQRFSESLYHFLQSRPHSSRWMVVLDGEPWFSVDERAARVSLGSNADITRARSDSEYEIISEGDIAPLNGPQFPMQKWLWQLSISLGDGEIFPWIGCTDKAFHMSQWPDFGALLHHADHVRVAALLTANWFPIEKLIAATHAKPTHVNSLINAAAIMGFVRWRSAGQDETGLLERAFLPSVFDRLRLRLSL